MFVSGAALREWELSSGVVAQRMRVLAGWMY